MQLRLALFLGLLASLLFTAAPAQAQMNSEALKLFKEGRAAIQAGDYNLACTKFEQSNQIDKRVGTMLNLALCEEKRTRLARALEIWQEAAALAKRLGDEREAEANKRAGELQARIPKLTVMMPADAPAGSKAWIESLTIAKRELADSEIGVAIPVDPGTISVTLRTPDGREAAQEVTLGESTTKTVTLTTPAADATPQPTPDPGASPGGADQGVDGLLIGGIVVGVVGLAGLGVGFGFGGIAKGLQSDYEDACTDRVDEQGRRICPSDEGVELTEDAQSAATISTALVVIGGVALAAGVTLIAVSLATDDEADATASRLRIGVTPTGVRASLTW